MEDSESDELVLVRSSSPKRRRVETKPVDDVRNTRAHGGRQHAERHILALNSDGPHVLWLSSAPQLDVGAGRKLHLSGIVHRRGWPATNNPSD